jgi:hypothetical protein
MKKRLIYALKCPFTNEIHYIGKSTNGMIRPSSHLTKSHSEKIQKWVEELKIFGHAPVIEVLYYVSEQENIDDIEDTLIKKHIKKGCVLLNSYLIHPLTISPNLEQSDYNGMKLIGEFIKNKRKTTGLTQVEFADRAGVGLRFLREIEQNTKDNFYTEPINTVLSMFGCKLSIEKINT